MRQIPERADRLVVVLSDVEMGAGGQVDDFPHSPFLAELCTSYNDPPYKSLPVDLVFNGDTFDLLKTSVDGKHPRHVTEAVALAKLDRVLSAHPAFLEGMRSFLTGGDAPRRVHFVIGNHDADLVFPGVQRALSQAIGVPGVWFPGFAVDIGDLRVEHGSQGDPMFAVDERAPILDWNGQQLLDLPWGAVALLDTLIPLQNQLSALDRVKPRPRVFEVLPEFKALMGNLFWKYWTREYLVGLWSGDDPMRKLSWSMLKEILYRSTSFDPDASASDHYHRLVSDQDRYRVVVIGHLHSPGWWSWADRKVLQAGCLRDEFAVDVDGNVLGLLPKVYTEVFLANGRAIRSHLVEVDGPPPVPGHVPANIRELKGLIEQLNAQLGPADPAAPR
ncbi:MAG: hypothetical protein ABMA64_11700 [Myxococcota bacterium]